MNQFQFNNMRRETNAERRFTNLLNKRRETNLGGMPRGTVIDPRRATKATHTTLQEAVQAQAAKIDVKAAANQFFNFDTHGGDASMLHLIS